MTMQAMDVMQATTVQYKQISEQTTKYVHKVVVQYTNTLIKKQAKLIKTLMNPIYKVYTMKAETKFKL